ncbi:response regulator [Leptolyngbya sp. GB1-A1]|uniref:response regulator n=1 Tax=Leptolyngbya sp. GB1-A1 TaxID=2933908 RepID=UPI003299D587
MANPNYRILVVDDLMDNLFLLQTVLEAEGYEVELADNGQLAIEKTESTPPDLILLDVMMPGMNGYEVTKRIRQNYNIPYVPILLVTAHDQPKATEGLSSGANDFIRKPIDFDELLARIRAFLQFRDRMQSA